MVNLLEVCIKYKGKYFSNSFLKLNDTMNDKKSCKCHKLKNYVVFKVEIKEKPCHFYSDLPIFLLEMDVYHKLFHHQNMWLIMDIPK